jgi:hypothetical protein
MDGPAALASIRAPHRWMAKTKMTSCNMGTTELRRRSLQLVDPPTSLAWIGVRDSVRCRGRHVEDPHVCRVGQVRHGARDHRGEP